MIEHMEVKDKMSVLELIEQMGGSGVLGAGRMYHATKLLAEVLEDKDTTVFMSIAGPMVPGGLRKIIRDMVNNGMIDVLITSGANITHDLLEAFGGRHYKGLKEDDQTLCKQGIGRIGDIYTKSEDFQTFEKEITEILTEIAEKDKYLSIREFLTKIGNSINDKNSILQTASKRNIPIYSPGLIDSMLGLQLWMFTQDNKLYLDASGDMSELSDIVFNSKKVATIILGGGLPKHYALASNLLKGGVDAAIQITMDRGETGSLSGAPLEEAKSWSKAKTDSKLITVIGDATIIFPLMLAGAKEINNQKKLKKK